MPESTVGRDKVLNFMKENGVLQIDLATQYGIKPSDFADMMTGKDTTARANKTILKIISDFKIR